MAETTLIKTEISGKTVRVRFADQADPPQEWIEIQVVPGDYVLGNQKLSEGSDRMPLGAIRLAALQRAKDVITAEMTRLSKLVGQNN